MLNYVKGKWFSLHEKSRSFFKTLFERRVPQFLGVYFGTTWVAIEFVDWLVKRYGLSPHLTDYVLVVLLSMIPTVVILAYFHGKPGRDKWTKFEKIGIPVNLLLTVALLRLLPISSDGLAVKNWGAIELPAQKHMLVLPFTNVGSDPTNQAFCDGLVETLTSKLTQLEQFQGSLWVVPANTVRKSGIASASEAHQAFGVNLVVAGSVQRNIDRFRLTLNLVDAKSLRQLSSSVIDDYMKNVFVLQDETVTKMAEMLNVELHPQTRRVLAAGGTTVPSAYDFYLQGRGYLQRYEEMENIDTASGLFERALQADSSYALAYAGLGEAYWRKYQASKNTEWVEHAVRNCERAVQLNDLLAPVHVTLGMIYTGTGRYEEAVKEFQGALAFDPVSADAYRGLATAYETQGALEEAESTYKKAIELKPDYWAGYSALGVFYYRHGRYEDAIAQFRQVLVLTPDNYRGYSNLGGIFYLQERWKEAREMFERSLAIKKSYSAASNLGTLYYIEGQYTDAARTYEMALEINEHDYTVWGNLAAAYYWAPGERDKAHEIYQRAIRLAEDRKKVNPHDPDVLSSLAGYYAMVGERGEALTYIEQALDLGSKNVGVMYRAGTTYEQLGDRDKALHWIGKALEGGYSRAEIEHQPELSQLLADPRFQSLLRNSGD